MTEQLRELHHKSEKEEELQEDIEAVVLAMRTLEQISSDIYDEISDTLHEKVSGNLSFLTNGKYDSILLDEELEPQNGHIIMRKLLEIRNFNTKVILLTKDNKYDYDDSYLQEGFTDYIIKSSAKEEILNKMNKYLS